jgi:hypothetical protein
MIIASLLSADQALHFHVYRLFSRSDIGIVSITLEQKAEKPAAVQEALAAS